MSALLGNYGAFEEALVKTFIRQTLQGLAYLHGREIIHRDIKGANILVDNKGGIKISDFGISKKVESSASSFFSFVIKRPVTRMWRVILSLLQTFSATPTSASLSRAPFSVRRLHRTRRLASFRAPSLTL